MNLGGKLLLVLIAPVKVFQPKQAAGMISCHLMPAALLKVEEEFFCEPHAVLTMLPNPVLAIASLQHLCLAHPDGDLVHHSAAESVDNS